MAHSMTLCRLITRHIFEFNPLFAGEEMSPTDGSGLSGYTKDKCIYSCV